MILPSDSYCRIYIRTCIRTCFDWSLRKWLEAYCCECFYRCPVFPKYLPMVRDRVPDAQALSRNFAPGKLAIGQSVTRGLGAGGVPMVGRKAAEESINDLRKYPESIEFPPTLTNAWSSKALRELSSLRIH